MIDLVPPSLALGLAGIDPAGLVIALSALAAGARDRFVLWFALIVIVGTALLGTLLTLTIGQRLQELDWSSLLPSDGLGAALELGLAIVLLVWAAIRVRRPEARPPRPARQGRYGAALLWTGVVFVLSAPLDPTFVGLVVVAGRGEPAAAVASAHLIWILVSQLPLVALFVAMLFRRHVRAVAWVEDLMPRARPVLAQVGSSALFLVGAILALDAAWWFATGRFSCFPTPPEPGRATEVFPGSCPGPGDLLHLVRAGSPCRGCGPRGDAACPDVGDVAMHRVRAQGEPLRYLGVGEPAATRPSTSLPGGTGSVGRLAPCPASSSVRGPRLPGTPASPP